MMASGGLGLAEEELRARPFRLQMVTSAGNQGEALTGLLTFQVLHQQRQVALSRKAVCYS